ncbi:glycoside hydrolase family 99-like domain-containing protein [Mucilaginibacter sp.]|uniref:glycosyltransferase WbsX family protein n=1 Tax=Mucilaginibacter sp. TaxID=1882438 RepID=UPI0025DAC8D4|nr:glycoside hydrolase family 99-like domain-containing protein [Mucilaginibacter sp.]
MANKEKKARVIAFYLPQFHPTPENDVFWGKGFTEWTNVGKAKPLFKGHYQPHVPADLGYYDLRLPETREAQADLAKEYGIEGFCYWHYWFGDGKRTLERPFAEVLKSEKPDLPFCVGWANETWSGIWHGEDKKVLIEQKYPGKADYEQHFLSLVDAFKDPRYIKVDGKPLVYIYRPFQIPDINVFFEAWRGLAVEHGLADIYFVGHCQQFEQKNEILQLGFDAVNISRIFDIERFTTSKIKRGVLHRVFKKLRTYDYEKASAYFVGSEETELNCIPTIIPNWDNSPRSGTRAYIMTNSTPGKFQKHIKDVFKIIEHKPEENRLVFLKSWNEWAEGNYVEPDLVYGRGYLEAIQDEVLVK